MVEALHELTEPALRVGVAAMLGGLLGIDRDLHHKPAGLRVLAMVAAGAAAVTMLSNGELSESMKFSDATARTVQGVLSGIGFIGAGVILRRQGEEQVHGITTASCVWVVGVIGIACGVARWNVAGVLFGLAWCILVVGRRIENAFLRLPSKPPSSP